MASQFIRLATTLILTCVGFCAMDVHETYAQSNTALLVAVTQYQHAQLNNPKLRYPEDDAKAVGELLKSRGYQVNYLVGPEATKKAIEQSINEIRATASGTVIIGFWGHGVQYSKKQGAMFCPFDSQMQFVKDQDGQQQYGENGLALIQPTPESLVQFTTALDGIRLSGAGNGLILADCCRNAPFRARSALGADYATADLPRNTALIFGCSADQKAFEDDELQHGMFTHCLLDLLKTAQNDFVGSITGPLQENVFRLVRQKTNGQQEQTVNPITNGVIRLGLLGSAAPVDSKPLAARREHPKHNTAIGSKNYALLVGINQCKESENLAPLAYAEADAKEIGEFLQSAGYETEVLLGEAATKQAIQKAMEHFTKQGDQDSTCLFGAFGHGFQLQGKSYFLPFDTRTTSVTDAKGKTVYRSSGKPLLQPDPNSLTNAQEFVAMMNLCGAGSKIALLDASSAPPRSRAFGETRPTNAIPKDSAFVFSCSNGESSFESSRLKHGVFAHAFLSVARKAKRENRQSISIGEAVSFMREVAQAEIDSLLGGREKQSVTAIINGFPSLNLAGRANP